ncbi:sterol desaturase family protein, partial [Sphingomonas sp.]|uniref:sterol desaturase family protein n=1 Tax=Sphingomonas sp. TaxID=28214 RepID=UPI00286BA8AC
AGIVLVAWPLQTIWRLIGVHPVMGLDMLPGPLRFALMLVLIDFLRYWEHRFEHRFWWPVHSVHHSVTELHAASALAHPLQALPEFLIVSIPLSFITSGGLMPLSLAMFVALQNLIIHSPLRVHAGPLRLFYVDSRWHRIHHSIEERHWHHNFGLVFSIWDRLFGTAVEPDKAQWPATGVPGLTQPADLASYLLQPFAARPGQPSLKSSTASLQTTEHPQRRF